MNQQRMIERDLYLFIINTYRIYATFTEPAIRKLNKALKENNSCVNSLIVDELVNVVNKSIPLFKTEVVYPYYDKEISTIITRSMVNRVAAELYEHYCYEIEFWDEQHNLYNTTYTIKHI